MGKPFIIWRNWLFRWIPRPNVSYSMCNCCGATTTVNGRFLRKTAIYNGKFLISGAVKWGLKISAPNYQKAHPYAKSGRSNRLAYVAVTLFWHYTATRKKVRENRHWKLDVVYNTKTWCLFLSVDFTLPDQSLAGATVLSGKVYVDLCSALSSKMELLRPRHWPRESSRPVDQVFLWVAWYRAILFTVVQYCVTVFVSVFCSLYWI